MKRAVVALTVGLAVLAGPAAGARSAAPAKPEDFMRGVLRDTVEARYAKTWAHLHPAHQRLAPRAVFVRCRSGDATIAGYRLVSVELVSKRLKRIDVPLVPQRTSTAVTLRFVIADAAGKQPAADATVHAVWIGTRWAWVLPSGEIPSFRAGRCP
jgi:hypothetical protein